MRNIFTKVMMLSFATLVLASLYACANTTSTARWHPVEVKEMPDCRECHTDKWSALSHTNSDFYGRHRFYAAQEKAACYACHRESFCSDCHAHKEEIKPSDKYKDAPERNLPHRGDYLNQHKIDGQINPTSCMRCHGRQNNERCKVCHR